MRQTASIGNMLKIYYRLLVDLTKRNFVEKYVGSYLGILWAFIQPAVTVGIFWFVFQVGFKSQPTGNFPFILWLVCGMFPWFFISDSFNAATTSILNGSYLVKKMVFKVELLPLVQIFSALIVHLFFVGVLFVMFLFYGYYPCLFNLQVLYYMLAMVCFVYGISLITSTLTVFLRDLGPAVAMLIQFGFWGTPIFWKIEMMPAKVQTILKLNPAYYIIQGYRDSFLYQVGFWEKGMLSLYFWVITFAILLIGYRLFNKLRKNFADVL